MNYQAFGRPTRHWLFYWLLVVPAVLSSRVAAQSQPCQESIFIGELSINSVDFERRGELAFLPVPYEGLVIADLSDPENPVEIGRAESGLVLTRIMVSGDLAVVKVLMNGVVIFDISDVTQPELVGQIDSGREHVSLVLVDDLLYAARHNVGVDVYDLSDPSQPTLVTTFGDASIVGEMELWDNRLYIAAGQLVIVDLEDPYQPKLLTRFDITRDGRAAIRVQVDQGLVVVGFADDDAALVDVQDPRAPELLSLFKDTPADETLFGVARDGDRAYLAYIEDGLYMYDIANPSVPAFIGRYSGLDGLSSMEFDGDTGYIDTPNGFSIIDLGLITFAEPVRHDVEFFGRELYRSALILDETSLLVSDASGGLIVFDVSDPRSVTPVTYEDFDGLEGGIAVRGSEVYVAAGEAGVHWLDISRPESVNVYETIDTPGFALDVDVWSRYLFVSDQGGGLQILDLFNLSDPIVGSFQTPLRVTDTLVDDGVAYVNDPGFGVYVLDVSSPSQPIQLAHIEAFGGTNTSSIQLHRDVLYVGFGSNFIQIYNVADPSNPVLIGSHTFQMQIRDAVFDGDTMYAGGRSIYALDVSNPARMHQLWRLDADFVSDLSMSDGLLLAVASAEFQVDSGSVTAVELDDCRVFCSADLNLDRRLDFFDVAVFLVGYMDEDPAADFNRDGVINFFDVAAFIASFQAGCP